MPCRTARATFGLCGEKKKKQKQKYKHKHNPMMALMMLQHTVTHCNILQYTAIHNKKKCNTLQPIATYCNMLHYAAL